MPVENLFSQIHALGQQVMLFWTLPTTLPDTFQVVILKKEGSYVTPTEETDYFATPGTPPDGVTPIRLDGEDSIYPNGLSDMDVDNGTAYYYTVYVYDVTGNTHSDGEQTTETPESNYTPTLIDAKKEVLFVIERVMEQYDMVRDKDYVLYDKYAMPAMHTPTIYVSRVTGSTYQQYIGFFRGTLDTLTETGLATYTEIDSDNIQVVWESKSSKRRDIMVNIFREAKKLMRKYLLDPRGANMEVVDITIEGDYIDQSIKDRTQYGAMMLLSCVIQTTTQYDEQLASWFEFKENVVN